MLDRDELAEKVSKALIGPTNGDEVPLHKVKVVEMIVGQTVDVLEEMGFLKFRKEKKSVSNDRT